MSTKALKKELLVAVIMLLVAAVALSGSTFAWFVMNNQVSATGMSVTTKTSNNLFIAKDTIDGTAKKADSDFKTTLVDTMSGLLEPVSSIDGKTFYYNSTKNANVTGDAEADTYILYDDSTSTARDAFNDNYGITPKTAVGYKDYVFQLKAINGSDTAQNVAITALDLTYGANSTAAQAFRAAILVEPFAENANPTNTFTTLSIAKSATAAYFTPTKAVNSVSSLDNVTNPNAAMTIGSVAPNTTQYYKVVIRLWIEGEDTTCNNTTFASLNDSWVLDVTAKLQEAAGISAMTIKGTAAKTNLATSPVATASNAAADTKVIDGVSYYKLNVQMGGQDIYALASGAVTNATKVYLIDENNMVYDVTNQCTLPE